MSGGVKSTGAAGDKSAEIPSQRAEPVIHVGDQDLHVKKIASKEAEKWPTGAITEQSVKQSRLERFVSLISLRRRKVSQDAPVRSKSVTRIEPGNLKEPTQVTVLPPGATRRRTLSQEARERGGAFPVVEKPKSDPELVKRFNLQRDLPGKPEDALDKIHAKFESLSKSAGLPPKEVQKIYDMRASIKMLALKSTELAEAFATHYSQFNKGQVSDWIDELSKEYSRLGIDPDLLIKQVEDIFQKLEKISADDPDAATKLLAISSQSAELTERVAKGTLAIAQISAKIEAAQKQPVKVSKAPIEATSLDDPRRKGTERSPDLRSIQRTVNDILIKFTELGVKGKDALEKFTELSNSISILSERCRELREVIKTLEKEHPNEAKDMIAQLGRIERGSQDLLNQLREIDNDLKDISQRAATSAGKASRLKTMLRPGPDSTKKELGKIATRCEALNRQIINQQEALKAVDEQLKKLGQTKELFGPQGVKSIMAAQVRLLEATAPIRVAQDYVQDFAMMHEQLKQKAGQAKGDASAVLQAETPADFSRDIPRDGFVVKTPEKSETFGVLPEPAAGEDRREVEARNKAKESAMNKAINEALNKAIQANPKLKNDPVALNALRCQLQSMWGQAILATSTEKFRKAYGEHTDDYMNFVKQEGTLASLPPAERLKLERPRYRFEVEGSTIKLVAISYVCVPQKGKPLSDGIAGYDGVKVELTVDCTKLNPDQLLASPGCFTVKETVNGFTERFEDVVLDLDFQEFVATGGTDTKSESLNQLWGNVKVEAQKRTVEDLRKPDFLSKDFIGECGRSDVQIDGEQVSVPGAGALQLEAVAQKASRRLHQGLQDAMPKDSELGEKDVELVRREIEDLVHQRMEDLDRKKFFDSAEAEKAKGRTREEISYKELQAQGKRPGYNIEFRDGKAIITATRFYQMKNIKGKASGKEPYDAHRTQIVIDLRALKPGTLLETPGAVTMSDVWHGQVDSLDKIGFGQTFKVSFKELILAGKDEIASSIWEDTRKLWEEQTQTIDMAKEHPKKFKTDCARANITVNKTQVSSVLDETTTQEEREKLLSRTISSGLREFLPSARFDDKEIHLLRNQIEFMSTQWMAHFVEPRPYHDRYKEKNMFPMMVSSKDAGGADRQPRWDIQIRDKKVTITHTAYYSLREMNKDGEPTAKIVGYDAHRTQIVIDLTKVEPGKLLLSEDCATATDSWSGFRKSLDEITW